MFEAVDKDTAWDGLVEAVGGERMQSILLWRRSSKHRADLEAFEEEATHAESTKTQRLSYGYGTSQARSQRSASEGNG